MNNPVNQKHSKNLSTKPKKNFAAISCEFRQLKIILLKDEILIKHITHLQTKNVSHKL